MKQAVLFFDIDGTLISDQTHIIPASTKEALDRLVANGHIPVINTGRPYTHVVPPVKALPFRDYVCSCGMYIRQNGRVIQDAKPDLAVCREMRDLVLDCGLDCFFEAKDVVYYRDGNFITLDPAHAGVNLEDGLYFSRDLDSPDFHFDKFGVWHTERSDYERFAKGADRYFTRIIRDAHFTELVLRGCSKGIGIRTFLESLPPADRTVFAVGDSMNDVEMFREADISILMSSGTAELKDKVDYVTDGVDDDGVLHALEHFGLI